MAALVAVTVSWQGVNVVGDQVTDERPALLSAGEIERRLAEASTAPPATPTATVSTADRASAAAPGAETRTYNLKGGTAALRFAPGGVEVVFANPAPGYRVEVEPEHGNGVKVEFDSDAHESRVDGWWDGGPVERVREEPND